MAVDTRAAAERTKALLMERLVAQPDKFKPERDEFAANGIKHAAWMLDCLIAGKIDGEPFSEGKANRWLGWAQCVVFCRNGASLDELRIINQDAKK